MQQESLASEILNLPNQAWLQILSGCFYKANAPSQRINIFSQLHLAKDHIL